MIFNPFRTYPILLIIIIGLLFSNCSLFKKKVTEPNIFEIQLEALSPDQYPDYITQLKNISQESSTQANIQKAHLLIAEVSVYHKNPAPDYNLALQEFEIYLKLNPEARHKDKILTWILLLKELIKVKNNNKVLHDQMATSSKNLKKLQEVISGQKKKIRKLKSDIKKLDSLYFNIERKKKKKNNHQ